MNFAEFSKGVNVERRLAFRFERLSDTQIPVRSELRRRAILLTVRLFQEPPSKSVRLLMDCNFNWVTMGRDLSVLFVLFNPETKTTYGCTLTYDHYVVTALRLRVAKNERELLEAFFAFWDSAHGMFDEEQRVINTSYFPNWLLA